MADQSQYLRWFNLRALYRHVFEREATPEAAGKLLADLKEFCRADVSCIVVGQDGHIDQYATAVAEGRREVYLRIREVLNLSDDALNRMKELEDE